MKQSLRDLNIAFARADVDAILAFFTVDIRWQIVGEAALCGTAASPRRPGIHARRAYA